MILEKYCEINLKVKQFKYFLLDN